MKVQWFKVRSKSSRWAE